MSLKGRMQSHFFFVKMKLSLRSFNVSICQVKALRETCVVLNADRYRLQLLFTYLFICYIFIFISLSLPQSCIGFISYHFPNLHKPFYNI